MHGSISAGAALDLFWSYNGLSIAYVYEKHAIQKYTFDHEVVILASPVVEKEQICRWLTCLMPNITDVKCGGTRQGEGIVIQNIVLLDKYRVSATLEKVCDIHAISHLHFSFKTLSNISKL